jgi:hypothetical protein
MLNAMKEFSLEGYLDIKIYIPISNILFTYEKRTTVKIDAKNTSKDKIFPTTHLKIENEFWFEMNSVLHQSVCVD